MSREKVIRKLTYQEIRGVNQLIRDVGVLDVNASKYLRKTSGALISIPQSMITYQLGSDQLTPKLWFDE